MTNTSDNSAGSLRSTIAVSLAGDTINFNIPTSDPGYSSATGVFTITLTGGELAIGRNLTISGPAGNKMAISGNDASRIFNILSSTAVSMSNLKISHGRVTGAASATSAPGGDAQGGGIQNQGTLNLTNCILDSNAAIGGSSDDSSDPSLFRPSANGSLAKGGGIVSSGTLNLINCTLSNNSATGGSVAGHPGFGGAGSGGAIWNSGTLTMAACTLNNDSANGGANVFNFYPDYTNESAAVVAGGGVFNQGTQTVTNCTFSGNSVVGVSGAFASSGGDANGGGTANQGSETLVNCTFSGNSAIGGIGSDGDGGYDSGNGGNAQGGGIYQTLGSTTARNTIAAGNSVNGGSGGTGSNGASNGNPGGAAGPDVAGAISSQGHNLVGITDGSSGWTGSDLTGVQAAPLNPQLGPLQNNGGPTYTIAPASGSAALEQGDDSVTGPPSNLATDQRGYPRKSGSHVDIGALELILAAPVTNLNDAGAGSLRDALAGVISGGTVSFAAGLTGTITLTSGPLAITKSVSVIGPGANKLTVSGNHAGAVVTLATPGVSISGLTLADGGTGSYGIADLGNYIAGSPHSFNDCVITGNQGGGFRTSGEMQMTRCAVVNNSITGAGAIGGGIYCNGPLTLTNCTVANNMVNNTATFFTGSGGGGGIYSNSFGGLTVIATTIAGNSLVTPLSSPNGPNGGGISNNGGTAKIRNSIIASNTVTRSGTVSASDASGTFTSNGYNLIGNSTGVTGFTNGTSNDQVGTAAAPLSPKLGLLANNGGPTLTMALLPGSPALDHGDDSLLVAPLTLTTDQRGFLRKVGAHVDVGALELNPANDFNGDANPDLVIYNPSIQTSKIEFLRGSTYLSTATGPAIPAGWNLVKVRDFNNDGKADLFLFKPATGDLVVWYMNGITLTGYAVLGTLPSGWQLAAVADLNADGYQDLILFNSSTKGQSVWLYTGPTLLRYTYIAQAGVRLTIPANYTIAAAADFNGDGKPDLLLYNPTTRQSTVWYLNGTAFSSQAVGPTLGAGGALAGVADFNGDNKPDLLVLETATRKMHIGFLNGLTVTGSANVIDASGVSLVQPAGYNIVAP